MKSTLSGKLSLSLLCSLLLFAAVACTDKETEQTVEAARVGSVAGHIVAGGPVALILVPDEPTALNDINAVVSGSVGVQEISYSWRVEGEPVMDAFGESLSSTHYKSGQTVSVAVTVGTELLFESTVIVNSVPEVERIRLLPEEIYAGVDVTIEVEATDVDGDDVGYNTRWFVNGTEVVTVRSNRLEGRQFNREDEISVEVVPYDEGGEGIAYAPLPITVPNGPPGFITLPSLSFNAKQYQYQAQAVDPDGDEVTYSLNAGPDGMVISQEGLVTWDIGIMGVGTHEVELVATDPEGAEAYQKYDLTIEIR